MIPAPIRPLGRPRYFIWFLFLLLFIGTCWVYRFDRRIPKKRHHKPHKDHFKNEPKAIVDITQAAPQNGLEIDLPDGGKLFVSNDWITIPEGATLPAGLDIEVDMQTHEKRVRLAQNPNSKANHHLVPLNVREDYEKGEWSPPGPRKWERKFAALHKTAIDTRLEELVSPDSAVAKAAMAYLDEHAHSVDIGAGLIRSRSLPVLLKVLTSDAESAERRLGAADILFACIQNNPDAIDGVVADEVIIRTIVGRLVEETDATIIKRLLSILISVVRGDRQGMGCRQLAQAATVSSLRILAKRRDRNVPILDRILVLGMELAQSRWTYAESEAALNLCETILSTLKRPYSDWMTHVFRPYCAASGASDASRPALGSLCLELNANPQDTSLLQ